MVRVDDAIELRASSLEGPRVRLRKARDGDAEGQVERPRAQPLHDHLGHGPTTRASFALYNTPEEVQRLIAGVAHALEMLQ